MGYITKEFVKEKKDDFVDKNFLLVSLEEKKAKKIAEVINNDTARKILDQLAKKDATESDLSKDLDIPISTVHYNLKQLQDAQLVTVEEFHYSQKGKEVNHYTLANKYIIIAPKSADSKFIEALRKVLPVTIITAIVGAVMTLTSFITKATFQSKASNRMVETVADAAPKLMAAPAASTAGATNVAEVSRPFLQSSYTSWFLVGALAVIIIYFFYEWMKKD